MSYSEDGVLPYKEYSSAPHGDVTDAEDFLGRVRYESMQVSPRRASYIPPANSPQRVVKLPPSIIPAVFAVPHSFETEVIRLFSNHISTPSPSSTTYSLDQIHSFSLPSLCPPLSLDNVFDLLSRITFDHPHDFSFCFFLLTFVDPLLSADTQYLLTDLFRRCLAFDDTSSVEHSQASVLVTLLRKHFKIYCV
ncbi:hypothetical protein GEMRC1_002556 [Eukaryota sp. GEM-RC1]